jgi:RNA polymerase sigma-70 factor, ECF subfamily
MRSSDPQLVRRMKANDRSAFEEVVHAHYASVYRQLWHLCGDAEAAADLTQETFIQVWRSLPSFQGRSALRTWIYTIAVRVWRRWHDRRSHADTVPLDEVAGTLTDSARGPAELAELHLLQQAVQEALCRLPAQYRETLVLFYVQGLKYHEIAGALGIPIGTVKSRLHGGLLRLRAALEPVPETEVLP